MVSYGMMINEMTLLVIPLFVHAIRKDNYGWVPYHMRPKAEFDTAPIHRYYAKVLRRNKLGIRNN